MRVFSDRCAEAFPDYEVQIFGESPTEKKQCPRMTIDFLGGPVQALTAGRARRKASQLNINIQWHKCWESASSDLPTENLKLQWLDEYDDNQARILDVLMNLQRDGIADGMILTGLVPITGITWQLPANSRATIVSSGATLKNLPIEYTTREEP
jgi:hypothetical protein